MSKRIPPVLARLAVVCLCLAFSTLNAFAQSQATTGDIEGRVLDPNGAVVPNATVTARNEATGFERTANTDGDGNYRFVTIKPGAYPWGNHENAWRPAHIHFSLFGTAFATRLVTQMYFPGDPLFEHDPIFQSVRGTKARQRLVSRFDLEKTEPEWALGYRWDIVLRGPVATPFEAPRESGR